jgi:hypothetical protein
VRSWTITSDLTIYHESCEPESWKSFFWLISDLLHHWEKDGHARSDPASLRPPVAEAHAAVTCIPIEVWICSVAAALRQEIDRWPCTALHRVELNSVFLSIFFIAARTGRSLDSVDHGCPCERRRWTSPDRLSVCSSRAAGKRVQAAGRAGTIMGAMLAQKFDFILDA